MALFKNDPDVIRGLLDQVREERLQQRMHPDHVLINSCWKKVVQVPGMCRELSVRLREAHRRRTRVGESNVHIQLGLKSKAVISRDSSAHALTSTGSVRGAESSNSLAKLGKARSNRRNTENNRFVAEQIGSRNLIPPFTLHKTSFLLFSHHGMTLILH